MTRPLVMLSLALLLAGCTSQSGPGPLISGYADLKPDAFSMTSAVLDTAGLKIPVTVQKTVKDRDVSIALVAKGQTIETERYRSTDDSFYLVEAMLEKYEPPLPLLKFPMHVGDAWDWEGRVMTGPQGHDAVAAITTSTANLVINGGAHHDVVEVDVSLQFDSGVPDKPVYRRLQFWIVKDRGVVKRKFGDFSARTPPDAG